MNRYIYLLLSVCCLWFLCSCNDKKLEPEDTPAAESEYFVKYRSDGLSGRYNAQYRDEKGKTISLNNIAGSEFERTIGPVKKGFECSFAITMDYSQATVRIEVKKDNEPFLVKKESTFGSVTYTIE